MSTTRTILLVIAMALLLAGVYGAGVASAPAVQQVTAAPTAAPTPPLDSPEVQEKFKVFWEAWRIVDEHFVDQSVLDAENKTYGAIEGMLDSLGDLGHTRFLSPEDLKAEREGLAGRFEGIGAEVGLRDGRPMIIAPLDGSPAERAGIIAGDVIVAIDGEDTGHMTLQEVIRRIRGTKGTPVTLSVVHPSQTSVVEITIVRDEIKVDTIVFNYLPQRQIGHIRITQFTSKANTELIPALQEMKARGAKALVIDLRNNPGGLLDQVVAVSSQFLSSGNVLLERDRSGNQRPYQVSKGGIATDIPIAVLINRGSASAAEIFAGAVKDNGRGKVIGEPTFGTGTVLSSFTLSDGSALLLATAEWLTPNGSAIRSQGIAPDIRVALEPGAMPISPRQAAQMSEDDLLAADAQLRAAIELLRQQPVALPSR